MKRNMLIVVTTVLLSGCVSVNEQPIDAKTKAALYGNSLLYTARKTPKFAAITPLQTILGGEAGASDRFKEGSRIVARDNIEDPAKSITLGLAKTFESSFSSRLINKAISVSSDDDLAMLLPSQTGAARFVLDIETIKWGFGYFPSDWTHYRVIYKAKAQLIDIETKSVVAEGVCDLTPESNVENLTYDELLSNLSERLKKKLTLYSNECVRIFKADMLNL